MSSSLPRSTPEAQGISSSTILDFINTAEATIQELHSIMIVRHGHVVAEGWWSPYSAERKHMLFSLSKSFTSTAIGLAVGEGLLTVDDRVIDFFPDKLPETVSDNLRGMRVRQLLYMSTGHDIDTMLPLRESSDGEWVKAFLSLPVAFVPGTHFLYNTGASYMLSAIVQKVTGQRLLDYLQPRLLQPLGIEGAWSEVSPEGVHMGGFGINIKTEDIAKFGQLYLQKGMWQGQRILSEAWVAEASAKHTSNGCDPNNDWNQGYGYQFWRCRHNLYRGDGAFGQFCIVMPEQDAVVAITSGTGDMGGVMNLIWDKLLPALENHQALPPDPTVHTALVSKLQSLHFDPPQGQTTSPLAHQISGKTYKLSSNGLFIESLAFDFGASHCAITAGTPAGNVSITAGYGQWIEGMVEVFGIKQGIASSVVWSDDDTLMLTERFYNTPFYYTLSCKFDGDEIAIDGRVNVAFDVKEFPITGQVAQHA